MTNEKLNIKIASTRQWEIIDFLMKESGFKNEEVIPVQLILSAEDLAWMFLHSLGDVLEYDIYERLEAASDRDDPGFMLARVKSHERFDRILKLCKEFGFDEEILLKIAHIRVQIEEAELRKDNEFLRSTLGIKGSTTTHELDGFLEEEDPLLQ